LKKLQYAIKNSSIVFQISKLLLIVLFTCAVSVKLFDHKALRQVDDDIDAENALIPPWILQPFVKNSI